MTALKQSLEDGRKHHAWIFSGPRGVGKYTAALWFAEEILGLLHGNGAGSKHPDIHVIRKEDAVWSQNPSLQRRKQTNIPIDLLRERIIGGKTSDDRVHDSAAFKTPVVGSQKVFIIDEAELLDEQGQNALLKTLEEPPKNTTIVLVTCREDLLLPTIKSRCACVSFSYVQPKEMGLWSENADLDVSPDDLAWAIHFSGGSPGLVCAAIETNLASIARSISRFLSREDLSNYSHVAQTLTSFIENTVAENLKQNSSASKEGANRRALELLLLMFGYSASVLVRSGVKGGVAASEIIADVERQIDTHISMKVLVDSLCARWAHLCVGDSVFM
ncbi:MAG: AAA family ATPase [Planctomycetes bacterium]|nr:AAA family ATPase [Planctomycetota bacterium]